MKALNNIGLVVLALWLVAQGMVTLFQVNNRTVILALPILAILSGVLMLLRLRESRPIVSLGFLMLSIWLILTGVVPMFNAGSAEMTLIMAGLGLAAGVLLLVSQ